MTRVAWILAQRDQQSLLDSFREAFARGPAGNQLVLIIGGVLALIAFVWLWVRFLDREARARRTPDYLTRAIDLLGFSEEDRRDLRTLARLARLPHPAAMLLSPENLAMAVRRGSGAQADPRLEARLRALSVRLFGEPLPGSIAPAKPVRVTARGSQAKPGGARS